MKKLTVFFFLLLTTLFWGQNNKGSIENNLISHTVRTNETVLNISKQHGVDPSLVYRYNRFALDKLEEGMILTFPAPKTTTFSKEEVVVSSNSITVSVPKTVPSIEIVKQEMINENIVSNSNSSIKTHKVQSGETLFGLSKKYKVSMEELKISNPQVSKVGLQIGQLLEIPTHGTKIETTTSKSSKTSGYKSGEMIKHFVQPKETLYGLSKKYGVSIESIHNQNKSLLVNGLQANQTLMITIN